MTTNVEQRVRMCGVTMLHATRRRRWGRDTFSICVPFMDVWLVSTVTKSQKQNTSCLLKKNQDYTNCITAPTRDATKSNTWNNKTHIPRVWINHKSATKLKIHSGNLLSVQTYIEIPTSLWKDQLSDYVLTFFFFLIDDYVLTWTLKVCTTVSIFRTVTKKKKKKKRFDGIHAEITL